MYGENFKINSIQISIFTPVILFSKNKILEKLMNNFADIFNGNTICYPIPTDAPKNIPQIILDSADKKLKLEIAENRVNLFRNRQNDDVIIDVKKFSSLCFKILKEYKEYTKATIGRLAVVTVKYLENKNPSLALVEHFCKSKWLNEPFNRPENFEIHSQKKYTLDRFNINSWVRCKTGNLVKENIPIVLITQDINSFAEELDEKNFSIEELKKFAELAIKEQEQILEKYFPEKE